jgi:release factor glutamine methyltransferase
MQRTFNPYELTQLVRAKIDPTQIDDKDTRPVEYITGLVEFCDLEFLVGPDVLIPRIETEWLVNRTVKVITELLAQHNRKIRILDLGTGSGAIAICLAKKFTSSINRLEIVASEVSAPALVFANQNATQILGEDHQIKFVESDLFDQIDQTKKFDIIITNLPYIPRERIDYLDSSVKDHEPKIALDGGNSGFELITKMLNSAKTYLDKNGVILLEIDHTHVGEIWQNATKNWSVNLELDEFTRNRFAILRPI